MTLRRASGGVTTPIWAEAHVRDFDTAPPSETEVLVIGGGIAGLTCAVELAKRDRKVTLIDDGPLGGGETGRTSAHLASAVDDRYAVLERTFSPDIAKRVAESHGAAIDYIEETVRRRDIACEFRRVDGYLFAPSAQTTSDELSQELSAARRAGLSCELVGAAGPFGGPALRFAGQAQFHPMRYLASLAAYAHELGVSIHTGVHADGIEDDSQKLRVLVRGSGPITARYVVDATNCDMSSSFQICLQQAPYRSYCIAIRGPLDPALYWETGDNYHYVRTQDDLIIVGGEDHRVGQADSGPQFDALEAWIRERVPAASEVVARWSGQIMEPVDGLAHIGRSPALPNVFLCTGDSGNGLTHGTIAGLMIPALIDGESSPWESAYDPSRRHLHSPGTYLTEAVKSAVPYLDWIRGGDVKSVDDIPPGEGALVREGLSLCAAYRDDHGQCHVVSAVCTHLKGIVQWNAAEKTWDCPCHGSRFDAFGTVINGPALANLEPRVTPLAPSQPGDIEPTDDRAARSR